MKKYILISFILILSTLNSICQIYIKMKQEGGVYTTPCTVNGLKLRFIFDTGASNVSISLTEAIFMLKNGYLSDSDIKGSSYAQLANGELVNNTSVNIRELEIGGIKLYNVKSFIIHELSAPLLLGQSALKRLGKIEMDLNSGTLILKDFNPRNNSNVTQKSKTTDSDTLDFCYIKIGNQMWSSYNLNVSYFRNGDNIFEAKNETEWEQAWKNETPAFCYYRFDKNNGKKYGKLYNGYVITDPRGIAPEGFHIPTKYEWLTLIDFLGGPEKAGENLIETEWFSCRNEFQPKIFAGSILGTGDFYKNESEGYWSSSIINDFLFNVNFSYVENYGYYFRYSGYFDKDLPVSNTGCPLWNGQSIRCIRD